MARQGRRATQPRPGRQTRPAGQTRPRNPRGQGARLRGEIVDAALRLLDAGVRDDDLSLRSVAAEAGIAAPSIYGQFADREDMLTGIVEALFAELKERLTACALADDAVATLRSMCTAYCEYAFESPGRYRALFARSWQPSRDVRVEDFPGLDTFAVLQEAVQACTGASDDNAFELSVRAWCALHGTASLRLNMPRFPWPALERDIDAIIEATLGAGHGRRRRSRRA